MTMNLNFRIFHVEKNVCADTELIVSDFIPFLIVLRYFCLTFQK